PGILAIQSGADVILLTSWGETTSLYKEMLLSGIKSGSFLKDGTNLLDEAVKKQIELKIQNGIMHSDFRGIKIETPVIGRHLANRGKRIKETAREIERLNPEKLNETISYYSIRSYKKEFSPLSQPEFKKYRSFVKELYLARELRNLNIKTEKFSKLAKALKSKNSKYFIIDSEKPEDLEKISKIITQNPKKNFILLHYGSPFLDFPKTDNVAILLSFSPTEGSLRALVKRAFNPDPKSFIRPADLILK
ncbi:MAG: hypothetical protein K8R21_05715, partial [Leptospira sp.]|nr:hypothetical protein [Leptospira sp.]